MGYDEPEILRSVHPVKCPPIADGGQPIGMPTCRPMGDGLFEVRSNLAGNRIARVLFCTRKGALVLLHGFIKKTKATPPEELALAKKRMKELEK
jgi:phage-related protein